MTGPNKNSAIKVCKLCKGEALVTVFRSDVKKTIPGATVTLKGPTPGAKQTDQAGWAEFKGLTPGSYTFTVKLPNDFYELEAYANGLSVAARDVALGNARAHPTGTLVVRVIDEVSGALVARSVISSTAAPQSISWNGSAGTQTFPRVAVGSYTITARSDETLYDDVDITKLPTVVVPEGGQVVATVPLPPKTWIAIVVHNQLDKVDVAKVTAKLQPAGGLPISGTTDGKAPLRLVVPKRPATCKLLELDSADPVLFEVVDVQSA